MRFRISLNLQNSYHLEIVHVIVNSQLVGSCQLGFSNLLCYIWGFFSTCFSGVLCTRWISFVHFSL